MAYYEGESLKKKIEGERLLPIEKILDITIQIAEGLTIAHESKIIHRDLKPANIMINNRGEVKIVDFGLAKLAGQTKLTKEGATLGTVAYMSPEQARGEEIDHRSDIWQLGIILYEMITGQLPFKGAHEQAIVYSIMNENPEHITGLRTGVPLELERILNKILSKQSDERYQHVDEMLVDLKGLGKDLKSGIKKQSVIAQTPKLNKMKYVTGSIGVLLLILLALFYFLILNKSPINKSKSVAVLPFKNLSTVKANEYFSDGITEDIISHLAKISDLRVISRTSVMRFKDSNLSMKDIGKELDVATILEGSVRREANQVHIVAYLIDTSNDENLWSETYDRELTEIFAIQSDVARRIANTLAATLLPKEKQLISQKPTDNLEAYSLCLKSRHHFLSYRNEDFEKGIKLAQRAIELDPNYALSYSVLAEAYYRATTHLLPPDEAMPKAKEAALRALEIDETVSRAHMALAVVLYRYEYDWDNAEKHFRTALELSPGDATIHEEYGLYFLTCQGRFDEAMSQLNHALKLDPYSAIINAKLSYLNYFKHDFERAVEQANRTISLHADYGYAYLFRGIAYGALGRHPEAIDDFEKLVKMGISNDVAYPYLAYAYLESGNELKAEQMVKILKDRVKERTDIAYYLARIYALWGRNDEAFMWLSEAYVNRSEQLMYLKIDPLLDRIRSDPRHKDLLTKIGLSP